MIQQIAHYFETQPVLKAWLFGSYSRYPGGFCYVPGAAKDEKHLA